MTAVNAVGTRKPFHEVICDVIAVASGLEMNVIGYLLINTIIPKGHDQIVSALRKRAAEMLWVKESILLIEDSILSQKRELEAAKQENNDSIRVKISLKGQIYEGNLDPEESFVATLMTVQRQGNNKVVEALGYLAELGDNHHMDPQYEIMRKNRLGF